MIYDATTTMMNLILRTNQLQYSNRIHYLLENRCPSYIYQLRYFASAKKAKSKKQKTQQQQQQQQQKKPLTKKKLQELFDESPDKTPFREPRIPAAQREGETNSVKPIKFMLATGSPYAFIASAAVDVDEREGDNNPELLFTRSKRKKNSKPRLFQRCDFHYIPELGKNKSPSDFGGLGVPEVAFLGRSNVGKSTLMNAIMRQTLAKVSKQPGRTQSNNYYALISKNSKKKFAHNNNNTYDLKNTRPSGYLVDLPGYGFARAPEKNLDRWQENTQEFLLKRRDAGTLKRVFLLVDSRLASYGRTESSTSYLDHTVLGWLEDASIPHSIVLTKTDSQNKALIVKLANEMCMKYQAQIFTDPNKPYTFLHPVIHISSGKKDTGVTEILEIIEADFLYQEDDNTDSETEIYAPNNNYLDSEIVLPQAQGSMPHGNHNKQFEKNKLTKSTPLNEEQLEELEDWKRQWKPEWGPFNPPSS